MQDNAWNDFNSLPEEAKRQVTDLIASLRRRYASTPERAKPSGPLESEPFVGMWQDREDLTDSTAWVRAAREREWGPRPA